MLRRYWPLSFAVISISLLGCSSEIPRYGVKGTIQIKGQPVKYGGIRFFPESGSGLERGETIIDGKYEIIAKTGLPVGKYKVMLTAPDRVIEGGGAPGSDTGPAPKELFPLELTDVTKTPLLFEVKSSGPNVFDFDHVPKK